MSAKTIRRRLSLLSIGLAFTTIAVAGCASTVGNPARDQAPAAQQGPGHVRGSDRQQRRADARASSAAPSSAPAASPSAPSDTASPSSVPTCGLPPCDLYVSRSKTRSLDSTLSNHSLANEVAVHLLVDAVCGGLLCVLGEGYAVNRVEAAAHEAAQNNECLRIHALPQDGHGLDLVEFDASNQSPYCTD